MNQNKKTQKRRLVWIIVLPLAALLCVSALVYIIRYDMAAKSYNNSLHVINLSDCESDAAKLNKALPVLGGIESCRWDSGVLHKDTFFDSLLPIGPSSYWLNGYAKLHADVIARLQSQYTWTPADSGTQSERFKEIIKQADLDKSGWLASDEPCKDLQGYYGTFYLDTADCILIFDLERD